MFIQKYKHNAPVLATSLLTVFGACVFLDTVFLVADHLGVGLQVIRVARSNALVFKQLTLRFFWIVVT